MHLFSKTCCVLFVCCLSILFFSCSSGREEEAEAVEKKDTLVTWSEDIAPILFNNCVACHRPGESGPFPLLSYKDAVAAANKIRFVTETRYMPPWPADPGYTHFIGERTLSQEQIDLIKKWVQQGKLQGDSTKTPALPQFYTGSFFGKPDLVIPMQKAVFLKGNGADHFYTIKLPYSIAKDTFVRYFEFVPDKRKLVHHVNGHLIGYNSMRSFDQYKGESLMPDVRTNFKEQFSKMGLRYTDKLQPEFPNLVPNTVYYLPGYTPPVYPSGIGGYQLKKEGAILFANIHYGPANKDLYDSSYVNVFFGPRPQRPIKELQLGTFGIASIEPALIVPPNEIKTFHTQWQVPEDISLLSVNPHMHLVGKSMLAYALTPAGDTIRIIKINNWDFRWQYYYTFPKMKKIPAGSVIHVFATYDNTAKNPNNPFHPPREISEGEGNESMSTKEEMLQFIFSFLPYQPGDENISLERK
jgi:mono/diheme cytochrome c family protein